jgi:hypothetical protein
MRLATGRSIREALWGFHPIFGRYKYAIIRLRLLYL